VTAPGLSVGGQGRDILELDVLRGIAALLMIANHAGYRLLSPADAGSGLTGLAVFLGSFAPVIFFFTTGFGTGLGVAASGRPPPFVGTLWKASLLVLADQVGHWASGQRFGLDFFSFIGLAMLTIAIVARSRHSMALALGLAVLLLCVRYLVGPLIRDRLDGSAWLAWLSGAQGVPGVSYPMSPWMVYPMLGFVLGRLFVASRPTASSSGARWMRTGAATCLAACLATAGLVAMKASLFRWGTMSAAFFVASIGVLAGAGITALLVRTSWPRIATTLALRGVASFAVIPLHYGLLDACRALDLPLTPAGFMLAFAGIVVLSWLGSIAVAAMVSHLAASARPRLVFAALVGALVLLSASIASASTGWVALGSLGGLTLVLLAQLVIAGLLGLRLRSDERRIVAPPRV